MELSDYISLRRAFNLVRQSLKQESRVSFEELTLLALLSKSRHPEGEKISDLASAQNVLRPTMTHRVNHLSSMGIIERTPGMFDHRNVCCSLSKEGERTYSQLLKLVFAELTLADTGNNLHNTANLSTCLSLVCHLSINAQPLILLALQEAGGVVDNLSELVNRVGLVQPTVSMGVVSLVADGLAKRGSVTNGSRRGVSVELTPAGAQSIAELLAAIHNIDCTKPRGIYG